MPLRLEPWHFLNFQPARQDKLQRTDSGPPERARERERLNKLGPINETNFCLCAPLSLVSLGVHTDTKIPAAAINYLWEEINHAFLWVPLFYFNARATDAFSIKCLTEARVFLSRMVPHWIFRRAHLKHVPVRVHATSVCVYYFFTLHHRAAERQSKTH